MPKILLYIACTIDGFIARTDGSVDWLNEFDPPEGHDYGYNEFYQGVDTVVMGRRTYEDVLGFDVDWPYANKSCLVATSKPDYETQTPRTEVVSDISSSGIASIRKRSDSSIWLVGGAMLIARFLQDRAVDEMIICTIPLLLGQGIPLFSQLEGESAFDLIGSKHYENGVVLNHYSIRLEND